MKTNIIITSILLALLVSCSSNQNLVRNGREAYEQTKYQETIELLEPVGKGNAEAAYWLGRSFEELALEGDASYLNQASDWYYEAVVHGHIDARFRLGRLLYFAGREEDGLRLLRAAAVCGNTEASQLLLSEDLSVGLGQCGEQNASNYTYDVGASGPSVTTGLRKQ
jgi:TPR repeat protein